eukprot:Lankesteria_metandrocarpae@DN4379_c0_g1_i1.p1
MLEAVFREASLLKHIVDSLKDIAKEINIYCRPEGLSLQLMDESHVALIGLKIVGTALKEYRCDQECILGLDLAALSNYIRSFVNDQPLILRRNESEQQVTLIGSTGKMSSASAKSRAEGKNAEEVDSASEDEGDLDQENDDSTSKTRTHLNRTAIMKLIVVEQTHYSTPENLTFVSEVCLPSASLSHIVTSLLGVSETLKLTAKPKTLEFSVDNDYGLASALFHRGGHPIENESVYPWTWSPPPKLSGGMSASTIDIEVSLAYMKKLIKACRVSPKTFVSIAPGIPLRLKFPLLSAVQSTADNGCYLEFFLAPKVGGDDGDDDENML